MTRLILRMRPFTYGLILGVAIIIAANSLDYVVQVGLRTETTGGVPVLPLECVK